MTVTVDVKSRAQQSDVARMKLSELSELTNQTCTSLQVALGFIMAFNTAILALLVSIGQIINNNCLDSLKDAVDFSSACKAILCLPNIIPFIACAVFAYTGGRTNMSALIMHVYSVEQYRFLSSSYQKILKKDLGISNEEYLLPDISKRVKSGFVERIYCVTAYSFYILCALFLAASFKSFIFSILFDGEHVYMWIVISSLISITICVVVFFVAFKQISPIYRLFSKHDS